MEVEASAGGFGVALWLALGGSSCVGTLAMLYNLYALFQHVRADTTEVASGFAKAAWGLSVVSFFLGPCGALTGLVAWFMGRHEQLRVMNEESSPMSLGPAQMASMNGLVVLLISLMIVGASVVTFLF
jgi:hypothetical protein